MLHMVCDLTIAADNAVFGQTGPKVLSLSKLPLLFTHLDSHILSSCALQVGSFDAGYGSSIMSRLVC